MNLKLVMAATILATAPVVYGDGAVLQVANDLLDQRQALLDFADAHPHPRVDIAFGEDRNRKVEAVVRRAAVRRRRWELAAGGFVLDETRSRFAGSIVSWTL